MSRSSTHESFSTSEGLAHLLTEYQKTSDKSIYSNANVLTSVLHGNSKQTYFDVKYILHSSKTIYKCDDFRNMTVNYIIFSKFVNGNYEGFIPMVKIKYEEKLKFDDTTLTTILKRFNTKFEYHVLDLIKNESVVNRDIKDFIFNESKQQLYFKESNSILYEYHLDKVILLETTKSFKSKIFYKETQVMDFMRTGKIKITFPLNTSNPNEYTFNMDIVSNHIDQIIK